MNNSSRDELRKKHLEEMEKNRAEREKQIKERWENLKKFTNPWDVPNLPIVDKEEWTNFYVPKLIEAGAIPKSKLKDGCYYLGDHRRAKVAQWNESDQLFYYWREKFGQCFMDTCEHFEELSNFAVFTPIAEVDKIEFDKTNISKQ